MNQAGLNRLYHQTRQGLQEIEIRVQQAAGEKEVRSGYAGMARDMPASPQQPRAEPKVPVPPSWMGGGVGNAGGSGFGATGGQQAQGFAPQTGNWNLRPCLHRKDIEVPTMSEVMSREQFLLWRDKVTDFLEATGSAGITPLLEALHTRRSECSVMDAVGIANGRGVGGGNTTDVEIKRASEDMYAMIRAKLNTTARSLCLDVRDRNGMEMYRRLSAKYAPATEQPHIVMYDQVQDYRDQQCKNFDESYNKMKMFERMVKEHDRVEQGRGDGPVGDQNKTSSRSRKARWPWM